MPPTNSSDMQWRSCFEQLAPKLLLFARQWIGSAADAEDVVQNAFVRFWRHQPEAASEHYPLLYAAVRTSALDWLRSQGRRQVREADERVAAVTDGEPFFDTTLEQRELAESVESMLQRLPPAQREVLVLRIWSELTFAEIATVLGESINTVASRYRYALEALRRVAKPTLYERL